MKELKMFPQITEETEENLLNLEEEPPKSPFSSTPPLNSSSSSDSPPPSSPSDEFKDLHWPIGSKKGNNHQICLSDFVHKRDVLCD